MSDKELQLVLNSESQEGQDLRRSFEGILQGELPKAQESSINHAQDAKSIQQEYQKLWKQSPVKAMNYVRGKFFVEDIHPFEREQLFEKLSEGGMPAYELHFFSREILSRTNEPELFGKSLRVHMKRLNPLEKVGLINEILARNNNPEILRVIEEVSNEIRDEQQN